MTRRVRGRGDAGETPVAVIIGLVVFALLVLSAGPAIVALTSQASVTSGDREVDKALAAEASAARYLPWDVLSDMADDLARTGHPVTGKVVLAGHEMDVTTWVLPDPDSQVPRLVVTKAIRAEAGSAACHDPDRADPATLPRGCVTRSVVVTAPPQDARPPVSDLVTLDPALASQDGADVAVGQDLFTVEVSGPTLVSVVARAEPSQLDLVVGGVARARMDLARPDGSSQWVVGNAVVCPSWVPSHPEVAEFAARLRTPGTVHAAGVLVLTAPAAEGVCP